MAIRKIKIKIFNTEQELKDFVPFNKANSTILRKKKICFAHSSEGIFAVADKCPHHGASLSGGWCSQRNSIVCPLHRYDFDLRTGKGLSGISDCIETYPITITSEGVFLEMTEGWSFWGK